MHRAITGKDEPATFKQALKNLATIEGLRDWVRTYNLKKVSVNAYQYYKENRFNRELTDHLANLVLIFPITHGIETVFGPTMSWISTTLGWPSYVTGGFLTVGALITVPGFFDPICIITFWAYDKSVAFQNFVTNVRVGGIKVVGFIAKFTGVKFFLEKTFPLIKQALFRKPNEEESVICAAFFI